ncbi:MAG: right-handed parallel beta-helix repeat-containing protein [Bacteroidia bacterium]
MRYSFKPIAILLLALATSATLSAKSIHLEVNDGLIDGNQINAQPGDTLLIYAGQWEYLTFRNMQGTVQNPIVAINYGGKVIVHSNNYVYYKQGINIKGSHYFKLIGNGDPSYQYGFEISLTNIGSGLDMRETVHHVTVSNVEIHHTFFAGIMVKEDPRCDGRYWRDSYVMTGIKLLNNYIHDTNGEGIYAGITAYDGFRKTCYGQPDTLYGVMLDSLVLEGNIMNRIAREGLQVFSTTNALVHNNVIDSFGLNGDPIHSNGASIGLGSGGVFTNNKITNGFGHGLNHAGKWTWIVANNLIENAGMLDVQNAQNILACGIYFDERYLIDGDDSKILNNTIANCKNNGLRLVNTDVEHQHDVIIANNIIYNYGQGAQLFNVVDNDPYNFKYPLNVNLKANFASQDPNVIGFVNAEISNYQLSAGSRFIGQGFNDCAYGDLDLNGQNRSIGKNIDLGAFENQDNVAENNIGLRSCDKTFYKNTPYFDGNDIKYNPGDTFCLIGDYWKGISIRNFTGTSDSPVVFRNAANQLRIDDKYYGLEFKNNNYVNLAICSSSDYGWYFTNIKGNGLVFTGNSNVCVSSMKIENSLNAAVLIRETADPDTENDNLLLCNLIIEQTNGKAAFHINRSGASKTVHTNFDSDVEIKRCEITSTGAPVLMLNHNNLNLEFFENTITATNTIVVDANKTFKLNAYRNTIDISSSSLFDLEGRYKLFFHNNLVEGSASSKYLFDIRKGANGYKQRDLSLQLISNTFNLTLCAGLLLNRNPLWDSTKVSVVNNAIAHQNPAQFSFNATSTVSYKSIGNLLFSASEIDNYFEDALSKNYYPNTSGALYQTGTNVANDTFKIDLNGENRIAYQFIDIGALISPPEQNGGGGIEKYVETSIFEDHESDFSVYPIPSKGMVNIEGVLVQQATVYDLNGKQVHNEFDNNALNLSELEKGTYILLVKSNENINRIKIQLF